MVERLSNNLAALIASSLNFDEDNKEVLAYGAFAIIQIIWSITLVVIFGLVFGVLLEAFIISLVGAILRKYSGGVHATAPNRCAVIGVIMSVGLALLINALELNSSVELSFTFTSLCFVVTYFCVFKYSPKDTPNKPIVKVETKVRLKKASLRTVHIFFALTIASYILFISRNNYLILSIVAAISGGLFNQSISLTAPGHFIILNLDKLLNKLYIK